MVITGHKGYIGAELYKLLPYAKGIDLKDGQDIRDTQIIKDDVIIHLAALVQVGESVLNPLAYYDTNINGTVNLLKNFKGKHFIFASTGAVAGDLTSPYAISKKVCEDIIQEYCTKNNINYTIFRFYNVIGGNPTNPDGLFYNIKQAVKTGEFNVYGNDYNTPDGTAVRDYVHVQEIVQTIQNIIDTPTNSIESLGHGKGYTVQEIVDTYKRVHNVDFKVNYMPRRAGDLESSVLDNISEHMVTEFDLEGYMR